VLGLNADYTHKFAEDHTFIISTSYSSWNGYDENILCEMNTDQNYFVTNIASQLTFRKDNNNYQCRTNFDYKRPLLSGTFEAGTQFRLEDRYENLSFRNYNVSQDTWSKNDTFSYVQNYINTIYSGYITYSGKIFDVAYQVGLRSEYFHRSIDMTGYESSIDFNKFMFYPSVHLSKSINKHQFQLSYSRRINRPQPWLLNNTRSYVDPYNVFVGSPYLKPMSLITGYRFRKSRFQHNPICAIPPIYLILCALCKATASCYIS
jgi:iron complex outermembrane receptor protein